jgi:TolB-like protein
MVFPFTAIGNPGSYQWIGTGVQQSLLVEVNRPGSIAWSMPAAAPSTQPVANPVADAARSGATIVVFGSFQIVNDEVRVTGQSIDTGSGQVLAALNATGSIHDLFKVEDALDAQLQRALPQPQESTFNAPVQEQEAAPQPAVVESDVQIVQPSFADADTYGIPYPYYADYGTFYGGFGGGAVFLGGRGFNDFHGIHNFGHGFNGGFGFGGLNGRVGGLSTGGFHGGGFAGGFHSSGFGGRR